MSTPLRVNENLFRDAEAEGSLMNRSAAKQVEFWAELGKRVSHSMTPADILALMQGIAEIQIQFSGPTRVAPEQVFAELEQTRASGKLGQKITQNRPYYEASLSKTGFVDKVMPNGERQTGHFENGTFIPE